MDFDWDEDNRREISGHGVSEAEAERAARDLGLLLAAGERGGERRFRTLGRTESGRLLFRVTTERGPLTRVVTVRDASPRERRIWRELHG